MSLMVAAARFNPGAAATDHPGNADGSSTMTASNLGNRVSSPSRDSADRSCSTKQSAGFERSSLINPVLHTFQVSILPTFARYETPWRLTNRSISLVALQCVGATCSHASPSAETQTLAASPAPASKRGTYPRFATNRAAGPLMATATAGQSGNKNRESK